MNKGGKQKGINKLPRGREGGVDCVSPANFSEIAVLPTLLLVPHLTHIKLYL